jgi:hypothetical protein
MDQSVLLVILALVKGDISASFANTANMKACRVKLSQIHATLQRARYEIVQSRCVKSSQKFTSYRTRRSKNAPRVHYLISFPADSITITPMAGKPACEQAKARAGEKSYCATSRQKLL